MSKYQEQYVESGDYVQIQDTDVEDANEWFRITEKTSDGFCCVDDFGMERIHMPYSYITDLKLESEMDYAF